MDELFTEATRPSSPIKTKPSKWRRPVSVHLHSVIRRNRLYCCFISGMLTVIVRLSSSSTGNVSESSDSDGDTVTARIGPRPLALDKADAGNSARHCHRLVRRRRWKVLFMKPVFCPGFQKGRVLSEKGTFSAVN